MEASGPGARKVRMTLPLAVARVASVVTRPGVRAKRLSARPLSRWSWPRSVRQRRRVSSAFSGLASAGNQLRRFDTCAVTPRDEAGPRYSTKRLYMRAFRHLSGCRGSLPSRCLPVMFVGSTQLAARRSRGEPMSDGHARTERHPVNRRAKDDAQRRSTQRGEATDRALSLGGLLRNDRPNYSRRPMVRVRFRDTL